MSANFVLKTSLRYFRAKKNEKLVSIISIFSLLGVMIGVAALIVVMSVMNGFHIELVRNIRGLNGDIAITPEGKSISNFAEIKSILSEKSFVEKIAPGILGQSLAIGKRTNSGAFIRGIDISDLKTKGEITKNVLAGSFADFHGKDNAALGSELAYNLGLQVGDKIKLISPNSISTAFGSMPRSKDFNIIAIFSSGTYDYDSATVLLPLVAAQNFLSLGNDINLIEVTVKSADEALIQANELQNILSKNLRATSWQMTNAPFLNALRVERVAMFTILSLIILVAAFNIISSLFMIVKDKTRDIAILRTMGASKMQIMLIFILNGSLVGLIGTAGGVLLGIGFAHNIQTIKLYLEQVSGIPLFEAALYFLYTLPSEIRASDVLLVASMSMILCCLATIYPAYKASRINPVEALKYE